jgi:hypothetical protein
MKRATLLVASSLLACGGGRQDAPIPGATTALTIVNATQPDSCPKDKPLVVDAWLTYSRFADFGADGHVWALDQGRRDIKIWHLGGDAYCVEARDRGEFETFGGASPEGTGTVRQGVAGTFVGTTYLAINGKLMPSLPPPTPPWNVGAFDAACDQDGQCSGAQFRTRTLFFSRTDVVRGGDFVFTATANAAECSTRQWIQTPRGDTGDIVCP